MQRHPGQALAQCAPDSGQYYGVAIAFILFDLETVFLILWALARSRSPGLHMLGTFVLFTALLLLTSSFYLQVAPGG